VTEELPKVRMDPVELVVTGERERREVDFFGHSLASMDECLKEYHSGLDGNTRHAIDSLEPLAGRRVLDFACGQGITTCLLAERGAHVIGIDITPESIEMARELASRLGISADFMCADLLALDPLPTVDRVFGRYALHHVDPVLFGSRLAAALAPGGWGAFVETTYTNPILRLSRGHLLGRFGVARLGSLDERPIDQHDFADLAQIFGSLDDEVAELSFMRILDRNALKFRWPAVTRVFEGIDDTLQKSARLRWLSYHHVLVVGKNPGSPK
jgi:SAM-dependent methyltransferase